MNIHGCMIVLDGMPWLPAALRSMLNAGIPDHRIHIVECVVAEGGKLRDPDAEGWCSADGTRFVLKPWDRRAGRFDVVKAGRLPTKLAAWNLALERAIADDAEAVLFLDADEILGKVSVANLLEYARAPGCDRLDFPMVHFFRDLHHRVTLGPWAERHRRFWLIRDPADRFVHHRPQRMRPEADETGLPAWVPIYHYGWVDLGAATFEKSRFYQAIRPDHPQYGRHLEWHETVFRDPTITRAVHVTELDVDKGSRVIPWHGWHPCADLEEEMPC